MSYLKKDSLFRLIQSLTPPEKRQFKLYVHRLGINTDAKFLLLFNALVKMKKYNEDKIIKDKITTKKQLPNLKSHLYKQILISLRMNPSHQNLQIQIREQLDFATILYNKGLYQQSLSLLNKSKQMSLSLEENYLTSDIVELEKAIESQYITRSYAGRAVDLIEESNLLGRLNNTSRDLSNLTILLYDYLLQYGYAKNKATVRLIEDIFSQSMPVVDFNEIGFREKLWFYKAHVWKNIIVQNNKETHKYALEWVLLFYNSPEMIEANPVWFLKGNHYLLEALFDLRRIDDYLFYLQKMEEKMEEKSFPDNENVNMIAFVYRNSGKLNLRFLKGEYKLGDEALSLIKKIEDHSATIDSHHVHILYFKVAALLYLSQDYAKALEVIYRIIETDTEELRKDLLFYSRILGLMIMIDSGMDTDLDDLLDNTRVFLNKETNNNSIHLVIVELMGNLVNAFPGEQIPIMENALSKLYDLYQNPYFRRSNSYLDIISWLESKIKNQPLSELVYHKFRNKK